MTYDIFAGAELDTGQKRERNEDYFYRSDLDPENSDSDGFLFIVADGVGGNRGGAEASQAACEQMPKHFFDPKRKGQVAFDRLAESIQLTHLDIRAIAENDPSMFEMCCTIVILAGVGEDTLIAHLGDARIYRLRDNELVQLTKDHSWVQEQLDAGLITAEEAKNHPHINVVTRTLGGSAQQPPDIRPIRIEEGDRFLLCSDGLHGPVEDNDLAAWLEAPVDPQIIVKDMVDHANRNGGPDNISAVAVQFGIFAGIYPPAADTLADTTKIGEPILPVNAKSGEGIRNRILSGRALPMIGIMGLAVLGLLAWLIFAGGEDEGPESAPANPSIVAIVPSTEESPTEDASAEQLIATSTRAPDATETPLPTATAVPTDTPVPPTATLIPEPTATAVPIILPTATSTEPAIQVRQLQLLDLGCDREHLFAPNAEIVFKWQGNLSEELESGQVMQLVVQSADEPGGVFRQVADSGANVLPSPTGGQWQVPRKLSAFGLVPSGNLNWWVEFVADNEIVAQSEKGCFTIQEPNQPAPPSEEDIETEVNISTD